MIAFLSMPTPDKIEKALADNNLTLGWVAGLNDLGSEVLTRLIPFYLSGVLGAPMSAVGAVEGIAESAATLLKPIFGRLSDRWRRRKVFVLLGYALSSSARPLLIFAGTWPLVALLRFGDRLGKGIRSAPRDALIADSSLSSQRGKNFGINRALDTLGAVAGVLAFAVFSLRSHTTELTHSTWMGLVALCSVPGFIATALVYFRVSEPRTLTVAHAQTKENEKLPGDLKRYLICVGLFSFANSSDAFILLRAKDLNFSLAEILGMVALLNIVSSLTAVPAAMLSDRFGRKTLIAMGWSLYSGTYFLFGSTLIGSSRFLYAATIAVYGLFFGFTESVERAWIADLVPAASRGRAYGIFGLVVGAVALPASFGFGLLWDRLGSEVPFMISATLALFATGLLFALMPTRPGKVYS